jgi:hypothetical protein
VAQAVVDHPGESGLARPHDRVQLSLGLVHAQDRNVGVGVEVAVALIENGEVGQTTNDWMSAGAYENGGKVLLRVHGATSHPMSPEHL